MWLLYAALAAVFAGLTSILAKCGIAKTDATFATAIRTIVVFFFAWMMVFFLDSVSDIKNIDAYTLCFLILSGLATGGAWICYFKALQLGDVNKVVPIDKSSTVLTMLLAFVCLAEVPNRYGVIGVLLIVAGTFLMIEKKDSDGLAKHDSWLLFAIGSAVFSALTAIFGKIGIEQIDSTLGTAIRTGVVLIFAWIMVFLTGKKERLYRIDKKELRYILLSGIATGASWICYYRALQEGPVHVIVPIDKLSILVTVALSYILFGERLNRRTGFGLFFLTIGTLFMVL